MVKILREDINDGYCIIIDKWGERAWMLYSSSKQYIQKLKKYLDENIEDIVYTLKTPQEVADYLQQKSLNYAYYDICKVPDNYFTDDEPAYTVRLGNSLIKIVEFYDLEDYM